MFLYKKRLTSIYKIAFWYIYSQLAIINLFYEEIATNLKISKLIILKEGPIVTQNVEHILTYLLDFLDSYAGIEIIELELRP